MVKGRNLEHGDFVRAPGAPKGYRYGDTVICPGCGHKTLIFRPRKKLWVCRYISSLGARCSYKVAIYIPKKGFSSRSGVVGSYVPVDNDGDACADLVVDVMGKDMAMKNIDDFCSGNFSKNRGSRGKFFGSSMAYKKIYRDVYRRRYMAVE